jgi:hypothetical protein
MKLTNPLIILMGLVAPVLVAATLDPASSNTKGYKPAALNCSGVSIYLCPVLLINIPTYLHTPS